jgi:hypothetical protein
MAKKKTESNFTSTIAETSRELTAKERVMYKDLGNAKKLNTLAEEALAEDGKAIIENVVDYAVIDIHNEASEDVDYKNYLIIDGNGDKYYTGSTPFWNSFKSIWDEMHDSGEQWGIQLNLIPSKNFAGKTVLTCSLI